MPLYGIPYSGTFARFLRDSENIMQLIGLLGLICIAAAWVPQTIQTIKDGRTSIQLSFLILYIVGSLSLTIYSIVVFDAIYLTLNSLASLQSIINLYYKLFPKQQTQ